MAADSSRSGSARLVEGLLALAMVLAVGFGVVAPLLGPAGLGVLGGARLAVPVEVPGPVPQPGADGSGVELTGPVTAIATVAEPTGRMRVGVVGGEVVVGLTVLGVAGLLLQVTRSLSRGGVFVLANARRLTRIAALVAGGGLLSQLLSQTGRNAVLDALAPRDDGVLISYELSLLPLLAALGIGVAAEVFRQGAALREDVEGLV